MRAIIIALTMFLVTVIYSPLSAAQSKKELAAQNVALQQRLERLEARMLTGDPAAETLMSRMDIIETANRNLTGEVERLRFERDNLRAEVVALAEDIRVIQEQAAKFNIHLDAVELVAKQSGGARTYAPRTYGGDTFNGGGATYVSPNQPSALPPGPPSYSSSNQPSFNGPTQPTYNSPNQPSALPSGPPSWAYEISGR